MPRQMPRRLLGEGSTAGRMLKSALYEGVKQCICFDLDLPSSFLLASRS